MLTVALNEYLHPSDLGRFKNNVRQTRLNCGVKVYFWLFEQDSRTRWDVRQQDEDWKDLRDAKADHR